MTKSDCRSSHQAGDAPTTEMGFRKGKQKVTLIAEGRSGLMQGWYEETCGIPGWASAQLRLLAEQEVEGSSQSNWGCSTGSPGWDEVDKRDSV